LRSLRNEMEIYRKNVLDLQSEIQNLRKEKENSVKEKLESNININKELEKYKLDIAVKITENERILNSFRLYETENFNLRSKYDSKNDDIKNLIEEKMSLLQVNFNKENLIENLKTENSSLKKKYEEKDYEFTQLEKLNIEKEKQNFLKEKKDREDFQNKIEELTNKLKISHIDCKNLNENSKNIIQALKEEIGQLIEEKKIFISKFGDKEEKKSKKFFLFYYIFHKKIQELMKIYKEL